MKICHSLPDFYSCLGMASDVLCKSKYSEYPIACIALWVRPAIQHHQIYFFYDGLGQVCGYLTWAWLTEDVEAQFVNDPNVLLHLSEWNEGDRFWILDFLLQTGDIGHRIREAFSLFPDIEIGKSLRRREDGSVKKITTWRRKRLSGTSPNPR